MKKTLTRLLSLILCLAMAVSMIPTQVLAYYVENTSGSIQKNADGNAVGTIIGTDAQGNTSSIDYDEESWTLTYPYGAFAFEKTSVVMKEGQDGVIRVYRLGGTTGRAVAYLTYQPVVTQIEEGRTVYDYAVSADDLDILVEEPQPIAKYQPVGKKPDPEAGTAKVKCRQDAEGYVLSLSVDADRYQWQVLSGERWKDITDSTKPELAMDLEYLTKGSYDYRCIYEKDGAEYCTDSYYGVAYEKPEAEILEEMPEDIPMNTDAVYTPLDLRGEGEKPYAGWAFELIFAEGEWVKEIHLDAFADDICEAQEAAAFTITDCFGGEVLEGASQLLMSITDTNESGPSELGFELEVMSVDKADGKAEVMITRTGDATRPVSIEWSTKDGTAKAGTDYVETSGQLMFYTGMTSLPATVELIDNGKNTDDCLDFTVELRELLGDDNCKLTVSETTVSLYNSGTGEQNNLASRLYDSEVVDASSSLRTSPTSAAPAESLITGTQQEEKEVPVVYSDLTPVQEGELQTQAASIPNYAVINFKNPVNAWSSSANGAASTCWNLEPGAHGATSVMTSGRTGELGSGATEEITKGIALLSKGEALLSFQYAAVGAVKANFTQMFKQYSATVQADFAHDTAYLKGFTYCHSYTHPKLQITDESDARFNRTMPSQVKRFGNSPIDSLWEIKGGDNGSFSNPYVGDSLTLDAKTKDFNMGDQLDIRIDARYVLEYTEDKYVAHEKDTLNQYSMLWLQQFDLYRNKFKSNAFTLEIATPNDSNNAPDGAAVISDYSAFMPAVSLTSGKGGIGTGNQLYVGSQIEFGLGKAPAGYYLSGIVVYQNKGSGWTPFSKFSTSVDTNAGSVTVTTVSTDAAKKLTEEDLKADYKFRLIYARTSSVLVDLSPSQKEDGSIGHLFRNSYPADQHGFAEGSKGKITYGYSVYDPGAGDYTRAISTAEIAKTRDKVEFRLDGITNLQWICFNLSSEDTLLINGKAYPGSARIYLTEAELNGTMNVRYYHRDFVKSVNAMNTSISWMSIYLDSNGNGKIDGTFDEERNLFIPSENADTFVGNITGGTSINETMLAPVKGSDGRYHQYFVLVGYTMTPRCLDVTGVKGATVNDRAAVIPAFTTAVNTSTSAYSSLTREQRAYRYVFSGKDSSGNYTSDNHKMYTAAANLPSYVSIPLGGDRNPAVLDSTGNAFTWTPDFYWGQGTGMIRPYKTPDPITVQESVAGPTEITKNYKQIMDDSDSVIGYEYTGNGANQVNGYLASMCGTSTFLLSTQEQLAGNGAQYSGGMSYSDYLATGAVRISSNCITMSGVSTTPDSEYLKQMKDNQSQSPNIDVDMEDSDSEMSEFNVDMGINLGSMELGVTEYVSILLDENKVGFSIGIPLPSAELEDGSMSGKSFGENNKEAWTQYKDFFEGFGGDDSYEKAKTARQNHSSGGNGQNGSQPLNRGDFKSKSFEVGLTFQLAFMFEFNPLDNGYYFEGMTVAIAAELEFRLQARLTVCPLVYFYFQLEASIEITTGLGVIRDSVEVSTPKLDASTADKMANRISLTYYTRPTDRILVTAEQYQTDTDKYGGYQQGSAPYSGFYYNADSYSSFEDARSAYLETGDFYLNQTQYQLLTDSEKQTYTTAGSNYIAKDYSTFNHAKTGYEKANTYSFTTDYKAFNITFSGALSVQVYEKQSDNTLKLDKENYNCGILTSDGTEPTQVVLKSQDGMKLDHEVTVVLRAVDVDDNHALDKTVISYLCEIQDIRSDVYWKGIEISPSVAIEVGAGIGVELLKVELYAKVGLEATFLLGIYNASTGGYDPAKVDAFEFSIGLGVRVVALVFTFELDAVTYVVEYDGDEWSSGFHFLNDWVDGYETSGIEERSYNGITIRVPSRTPQNLYAAEDNSEGELSTQAVSLDGIPFQTSGYSSSVAAAVLSDQMMSGSQYRIFRAGGRNFMIYTLSRSAAAEEDSTMLVLSELTYLKNGADTGATYGLANPVDSTSAQKYIVLDTEDAATGDLDFNVFVEESLDSSCTVHAAWVSYADPAETEPSKPEGQKPEGMSADTYEQNSLTQPILSSYVTDAEESAEGAVEYDGRWVLSAIEGKTADEALQQYAADLYAYNNWKNWHDYYAALNSYEVRTQQRLDTAARNTVVKTAQWSFTPADGNTDQTDSVDSAFSTPVVVGGDGRGGDVNLVFRPVAGKNAVFFASTDTLDNGSAYAAYETYLAEVYKNPDPNTQKMVNGLKAIRKSSLDIYGTRSALNAACGSQVYTMVLGDNQVVSGLEAAEIGGAAYVAYTTTEYAYQGADMVTITRLFVRTFDTGSGEWGNAYLLRQTCDYERNSKPDGCYENSALTHAYDSAYLSGIQFLNAKLSPERLTGGSAGAADSSTEQSFLLFEMNGATYILLSSDLQSITAGNGGTLYPFFGNEVRADGQKQAAELPSGKDHVTIGADAEGVPYAVYTAAVQNTTNNALYISKYDSSANTWGEGVLLAMNNMNVYENAQSKGWDAETTQAAYLGAKAKGGLLTEADIIHLYGESDDNGNRKENERSREIQKTLQAERAEILGDDTNFIFGQTQAVCGTDGNLLVVAEGALTQMTVQEFQDGSDRFYTVIPTREAGAGMKSDNGLYAVSYGGDAQALGNGIINFAYPDFSKGSCLNVEINVTNVGTTTFRYSPTGGSGTDGKAPVTAELYAGEQKIASWTIERNFTSGQTIYLDGRCAALEQDLPVGTEFTLLVKEDSGYFSANAAEATAVLFTVEGNPDLSVENLDVSIANVAESSVDLNLRFDAANRGAGTAEDVYAQVTYRSGTDSDGNPEYSKLDVSEHAFEIGQETALTTFAFSDSDMTPANGIIKLYGKDLDGTKSSQDLKAGYSRTVTGLVTVPSSCFNRDNGSLEVKVELFSSRDSTSLQGGGALTAVSRQEYYTANNLSVQTVSAQTDFTCADSIIIPLGTTTLIPMTAVSALGSKPSLITKEIDDTEEGDGYNLGIVNYKLSSASSGKSEGVVSITPVSIGNGIIEISDMTTNTKKAITFTVTAVGEGIDIFNDNNAFAFKNADGKAYDRNKDGQDWSFIGANEWGQDPNQEVPMRNNLAVGSEKASFTFQSVAESIDLYFSGSVSVTSDYPGYGTKTFSGSGGSKPVTIDFGPNERNKTYSITVQVSGKSANFDRMVEHYSGGTAPIPTYDASSPNLYWSRSFPATASIQSGTREIPLMLYVLDNEQISYLTVNGQRIDADPNASGGVFTKIDSRGQLWSYDFGSLKANGNYEIAVYDNSGNMTSTTLVVDWFAVNPSGSSATVAVPESRAEFRLGEEAVPAVVTDEKLENLNITFLPTGAESYEVSYLSKEFTALSGNGNVYSISETGNGIYLTYAYGDADRHNWSCRLLSMEQVDGNIPHIDLMFNEKTQCLDWKVYKDGSAPISAVTVNGVKVNTNEGTTLSGSEPLVCNGEYSVSALVDTSTTSSTITVTGFPVSLSNCTVSVSDTWNPELNNGSVTADMTGISGGTYSNPVPAETALTAYTGSYELALVPVQQALFVTDEDGSATNEWAVTDWQNVSGVTEFTGLTAGDYLLVVRDWNDIDNYSSTAVTVKDDPITVSTAVKGTRGSTGEIAAVAQGGNAPSAFEYAILPVKKAADAERLEYRDFTAQATEETPVVWHAARGGNDFVIDGLESGSYYVAVRGVYGADAEAQMLDQAAEALRDAQTALADAQTKLTQAEEAAAAQTKEVSRLEKALSSSKPDTQENAELSENLEDARKELAIRQSAVTAAQDVLQTAQQTVQTQESEVRNAEAAVEAKGAQLYTDDCEYWNGITVLSVTVPKVSSSSSGTAAPETSIESVETSTNDCLVYGLTNGKLTEEDSGTIIRSNETADVELKKPGAQVFVPTGVLKTGDDVNCLLVTAAADGSDDGKVIRYTDPNGIVSILPFGIVEENLASYFAQGTGTYEIIPVDVSFRDTDGLWGEEYIEFVAGRELFNGTGDGLFSPNVAMNRAMFVTVLWRMNGCPDAEGKAGFSDLTADWYAESVAWASENGIVQGYSKDTFGPNDPITREQMCVLILRYLDYMGMELKTAGDPVAFKDAGNISSWAVEAVRVSSSAGLINGYEGALFVPKNSATRMEVSAILTRFITTLVNEYCG